MKPKILSQSICVLLSMQWQIVRADPAASSSKNLLKNFKWPSVQPDRKGLPSASYDFITATFNHQSFQTDIKQQWDNTKGQARSFEAALRPSESEASSVIPSDLKTTFEHSGSKAFFHAK